MRFYKIVITNVATQETTTYTSLDANGLTILGALNIELDVPVSQMATPAGNALLKIWGISLDAISQSFDLNPINGAATNTIQVYAGMAKGLPLANPQQAGLIMEGQINQAFGNAIGVDRSIEFVIVPTAGTATHPVNISTGWPAGMPLGTMIQEALTIAYPDLTVDVNVSPNLVLNQAEPGFFGNLLQFAGYVKEISQHIMGNAATYPGVNIVVHGNKISVYDGTVTPPVTAIVFTDLIGQPTWIGPSQIQFKTVMRADLNVGENVTMPDTNTIATVQTKSQLKNAPIFQGEFSLTRIRHAGNFRQADANSWVTIVDAARISP